MRSLLLVVALLLPPGLVGADPPAPVVLGFDGVIDDDGVPAPWEYNRWSPMMFMGDSVADARVVAHASHKVLQLISVDSGFIVGVKRPVDLSQRPHVRWRWRADALPVGGHFANADHNDQALQLLFGFAGNRVVGYIWDTTGPAGASGDGMAWRTDTRVIVLRDGTAPLGRWLDERRDLRADYQRLFGEPPGPLEGVAIQTNSQHTDSRAEGYVGPISFEP